MQSWLLVALTLANSIAGFVLQVLIVKLFGVGVKSDAYFRALAGPLFCTGLFAAQSTFRAVPALMSRSLQGSQSWWIAAKSYFQTSIVIGLGLAILGTVLWPPGLARGTAGLYDGLTARLGILCWIYGATQIPLVAVVALLQSRHRYATALIVTSLPQVATCAVMALVNDLDIVAIPALLATASATCVLVLSVVLLGNGAKRAGDGSDAPGFGRRIVLESPYTVATLACFSVYAVIDSVLLPRFGSGFLTSANLCQRLVIGLGQLLIAAPMTLITRDLVLKVNAHDAAGFERHLWTTLVRVVFHASLLAAALFVAAGWMMYAIISSRSSTGFDTTVATRTLRHMLPGMVLMLASNILVRSALTIPGLVRRTWWLGAVWGILYAVSVELISSPQLNGSGYAYSISWVIAFASFGWFVKRYGRVLIIAAHP